MFKFAKLGLPEQDEEFNMLQNPASNSAEAYIAPQPTDSVDPRDALRERLLSDLTAKAKANIERGKLLTSENQLSRGDFERQSEQQGMRAFASTLQSASNSFGSQGGRNVNTEGVDKVGQALNAGDASVLKGRQGLYEEGKSLQDSGMQQELTASDLPSKWKSSDNQLKVQENQFTDRDAGLAKTARESDPTSQESKTAQAIALNMGLKIPAGLSYTQIEKVIPHALKQYDTDSDGKIKRYGIDTKASTDKYDTDKRASTTLDINKANNATKTVQAESKAKYGSNKDVQSLGKFMVTEKLPERKQALGEVMALLNDPNNKVDLAGIGLFDGTFGTRTLTPEGRRLSQAIQRVVNTKIKADAGSAVTGSELERVMMGVGVGRLKTEAELRYGMEQLEKEAQVQEQAIRSGFTEDTNTSYDSNFQRISTQAPASAPAPSNQSTSTTKPSWVK